MDSLLNYGLIAVAVILIFFMFRNSRKRKRDAQEMQNKLVPGAHVMTNFGVFGDVKSVDLANDKVVIETSPRNTLTVHRQAIARVVDRSAEVAPTMAESIEAGAAKLALDPEAEAGKLAIEPRYGERKPVAKATPRAAAKPAAKSAAKGSGSASKSPSNK